MMYRGQQKPPVPPISALSKQEQANSILLMNIFSTVLNDPGEMAHPVAIDALHVIQSEVIPRLLNRFFDFVTRGKLLILEDSLNMPKSQKSHGLMSGE
jgi:hypothetical protein